MSFSHLNDDVFKPLLFSHYNVTFIEKKKPASKEQE